LVSQVETDFDECGGLVFVVQAARRGRGSEKEPPAKTVAGLNFCGVAGHRAGRLGIGQIMFDAQGEGKARGANFTAPFQNSLRDGDHLVLIGIGDIQDDQFIAGAVFGVVF